MTASSRRRVFALAVVVAVAAAVGLGSYLIVADGRTAKSAKEGGKGKGGGAVPVTVARVMQETVPVRLNAIGNVEAYSTVQDNQRHVHFGIYQGEARMVQDNVLLGEIDIPVPPGPAGVSRAYLRERPPCTGRGSEMRKAT